MSPEAASLDPREAQQRDHAAYREAPYPSYIHTDTLPSRVAAIARLSGMRPPVVSTARVLEIGCGDGMNLMAMAQTLPEARFTGFDILDDRIALGRERARRAGLDNVELHVADIMDEQHAVGEFDYIIAHGVYAWVPPPVADALMALIGRRLAPGGLALVSYNALPGSYLKIALRDAMLGVIGDAPEGAERLRRAHALLEKIAERKVGNDPAQRAMQAQVERILATPGHVLLHDELGAHFRPQYLQDVVVHGQRHGLKFLGDAGGGRVYDGIWPEDVPEPDDRDRGVVARAIADDLVGMRLFRSTLFTRETTPLPRELDLAAVDELWIGVPKADEDGRFRNSAVEIEISEPALLEPLRQLAATAPARMRRAEAGMPEEARLSIVNMFNMGVITLDSEPYRGPTDFGEVPVVTPLARVMLDEGATWVPTLHPRMLALEGTTPTVVRRLDGTIDAEELSALGLASGFATPETFAAELRAMRKLGIFAH